MSQSLFSEKGYLSSGLVGNASQVHKEVERMTAEELEKSSVEALVSKFSVKPLVLVIDGRVQTLEDVKIDVSHDFLRGGGRGRGRLETNGVRLVWTIPYEGDSDLWDFTPSTHSLSFPRGSVSRTRSGLSGKLVIVAEVPSDLPEDEQVARLQGECEKNLSDICKYIQLSTADVEAFNERLPEIIKSVVKAKVANRDKAERVASALEADFVEKINR